MHLGGRCTVMRRVTLNGDAIMDVYLLLHLSHEDPSWFEHKKYFKFTCECQMQICMQARRTKASFPEYMDRKKENNVQGDKVEGNRKFKQLLAKRYQSNSSLLTQLVHGNPYSGAQRDTTNEIIAFL